MKKERLHILFVTPAYKPANKMGGPIHSVSALAESLTFIGHEVVVFTTNTNYNEVMDIEINVPHYVNNVEVWYFNFHEPLKRVFPYIKYLSDSMGFLYSPTLRKHIMKRGKAFDLIHTHMPFIYPTYAAIRAADSLGIPIFYHQRGILGPIHLKFRSLKKTLYLKLVELRLMRMATTLVALTEYEVEIYRHLGLRNRCYIIPNGINADHYRTEPSTQIDLGVGDLGKAKFILYLGQLLPIKGPDLLLEAFIRISPSFPDTMLVFAGPDPRSMKASLMKRVIEAGIGRRVFFMDTVSGNVKIDLLAAAEIFCLPSAGEGFSMAILEALASGTLVLISAECHFPQVVEMGAGLEVKRSPESIAEGLRRLLSSTAEHRRMGKRARWFVEKEYAWKTIAEKMVAVYREGINRFKQKRELF